MDTDRLSSLAQSFLSRADLKGREVEAFAAVHNWLEGLKAGELIVLSKEDMNQIRREMSILRDKAPEAGLDQDDASPVPGGHADGTQEETNEV